MEEEEKEFHFKSDIMQRLMETDFYRQKFAYQLERWVPTGDNTCPLCNAIANLEWLPFGTLPPFKKAHSTLGDGNWKAPDSSCQCTKAYKRTKGDYPGPMELIWNGTNWRAEEFTRVRQEFKAKIIELQKKYKCECK